MAGIAFWGGFASGMSKSIEKNRDRKQKQDEIDKKNRIAVNKAAQENKKKQYELSLATREAFNEMNERIVDIKSGKVGLTESEAIDEINYLNKQKIDIYDKALNYGTNIEMKDPRDIIDITKEDIGQIGVYNSYDGKYVVNKELGEALDSNQGEIKIGENGEVQRWKVAQNSTGQWIPEKDANGDFVYESTGEFLPRTTDIFKPKEASRGATSLEQDKQSFLDMKDAEKAYKANPTPETLEKLNVAKDILTKRTLGTEKAGQRVELENAVNAVEYGKEILKNPSAYDEDAAYINETKFKYTKAYTGSKSLKTLDEDFTKGVESFNRNKGLFDVFDQAVKDGTYKSGIVQGIKNTIGKYTTKEFADFIELDREEIKKIVGLEGQLGDGVATYLKGLSGTAASQAEFVRTMNNFIGGDFTQEDFKQDVFSNFIEKKARDLDVSARMLAKRGLSYTAGSWLNRNNKQPKTDNASVENIGGVEYETRTINGKKQYKNPSDGKWYQPKG